MEGINFYMINLDRAVKRREAMKSHYDENNLIRIPAYDGKHLETYPDIRYLNDEFYREQIIRRIDNPALCRVENEAACSLSHIKAIVSAYFRGEEGAIIIEDDILNKFHRKWPIKLREIISNTPSDCDVLYLHEINETVNREMISRKELISRKHADHYSNGCYYITRNGMEKIVNKYFVDKTIDIAQDNKRIVADINLFDGMNQYQYTKPLFNSSAVDSFIRGKIDSHKNSEIVTNIYFDKTLAIKLAREKHAKTKFKRIFF